ncbi:hypothetical protein B0H17DRAFT_1134937 [Mycena rosella]|uniref:Uncharacterized protein n=1 Tax=Mycena rosella TaxID=1033263 RepID=A0AAD7DHC5_MYCRO|nr:hypothetical protein B0H17DRAFT_1134937 [Mycena rosella]
MSASPKRTRPLSIVAMPFTRKANEADSYASTADSHSPLTPPSPTTMQTRLPSPVSPTSLSMPTPSMGSDEVLPPPKRGAPPVAPAGSVTTAAEKRRSWRRSLRLGKPVLDPALCEGWN